MANAVTTARIQAIVEGLDQIEGLKGALKQLSQTTSPASENIDKLKRAAVALGDASSASTRDLRTAASVLRELKDVTQIASKEYNDLARSLQGVESRLNAATSASRSFAQAQSQASRNSFSLSGAGRTRGATQYSQAIGPQQLDSAAINQGLDRLKSSLDQFEQLQRDSRIRQLETNAKFDGLELDRQNKAAAQQLRAQQQSFEAELKDFDTRLNNRVQQRQQKRDRFRNVGQTVGAIAASSVFGGPEGAIGAGIGAIGGPGAALAGGAIGAQVGMLRQQVGEFATYAADIQKLQIALKGVTKTQSEYEAAVRASAAVTRDFNVPQLEATKGMTQLSAAVIGAGGKVADAEVVFRNVTAAIKATGGSSEDVQGAITALSQIFSKGKVSAEELQGQLGERLPGAVTMFAAATGRTLPQLQKDLEQGVVGLADLMKFVVGQEGLGQFEQGAKRVASSSAEAGARLVVTWNETKQAIGQAVAPLGAQIQDSLGRLLKELTPALIESAKGLAAAIKLVVDNFGAIANIVKFAAQLAALNFAIKGFVALQPGIVATFAAFQAGGIKAAASALGATSRVQALSLALRSIAKLGIITVGINLLVNGIDRFNQLKSQIENLKGYDPNKTFTGASRETVAQARKQAAIDLANARENLKNLDSNSLTRFIPGAALFDKGITDYNIKRKSLETAIKRAEKTLTTLNAANFKPQAEIDAANNRSLSSFTQSTQSGSEKDSGKKAEQEAAKQEQLALQTAEAQRRLADQLFQHQVELDRKRYELQQRLNDLQTENQINSLTGVAREYASMQQQMSNKIRDFYRESEQAAQKVLLAEQQLRSAQSVQSIAGSGSGSSVAGFTATQLQAASREAGKFTGIANMCAESVKAFYKSLGITLPGVTAWADTVRKAGQTMTDWSQLQPGDIVATGRPGDTPHVGVYTGGNNVFHQSRSRGLTAGNYPDLDYFRRQGGYFVRPNTAPMGGNRALLKANAAVGTEAIDLQSARETLKLYQEFQNPTAQQLINSGVIANTQAIRDRLAALKEESAVTQISNRLKLEGARPELIEQETSLKKLELEQTQKLAEATSRLATLKAQYAGFKDQNSANALTVNADIQIQERTLASLPELYQQTAQSIREATAAQIAFNDAMRFRQDMQIGLGLQEGAQKYVESIGTMRDATAQLAQNGIKGLEDQLVSLVTTGTANFREFASSILKDTARMIIQQLVLRNVMQLIGALTPGGGGGGGTLSTVADNLIANPFGAANGAVFGNGLQPFAMGGIVNKPTMFRYASGGAFQTGLMGEAGPEAIVPLRRGRDGKLGIAGGGGQTSVVVNVDAKGTNVQGDNGKGEGLGRVLAAAVQQELIRQRRPGGLLAA